jgi:hypothetical protein
MNYLPKLANLINQQMTHYVTHSLIIRNRSLDSTIYTGNYNTIPELIEQGSAILARHGLESPSQRSWYRIVEKGSIKSTPYIRVLQTRIEYPQIIATNQVNPIDTTISRMTVNVSKITLDNGSNDPIEEIVNAYRNTMMGLKQLILAGIDVKDVMIKVKSEYTTFFERLADPRLMGIRSYKNSPQIYTEYLKVSHNDYINHLTHYESPITYIKKSTFNETYVRWCNLKRIIPDKDYIQWFDKVYQLFSPNPECYIVDILGE